MNPAIELCERVLLDAANDPLGRQLRAAMRLRTDGLDPDGIETRLVRLADARPDNDATIASLLRGARRARAMGDEELAGLMLGLARRLEEEEAGHLEREAERRDRERGFDPAAAGALFAHAREFLERNKAP